MMSRVRKGRETRDEGDAAGEAGAPVAGKRSLVASRYPVLGKALGDRGGDTPSIHDAATAAVEGKGGGSALDAGVAERVGSHLGADFSGVRVHGDPLSQEATRAMGARAFAYGADVFLGPGESGGDLGLMAHELTHVVQQGAAGQRSPQRAVQVGEANTPAEQQADQVSAEVTGGQGRPQTLLVDHAPVRPGQMLKSTFIAMLREQVTAAANQELGPIYAAIGCPYIEQYFGRYAGEPAAASEALLRRFAPATRSVQTAAEMMPLVVTRVREGVRAWRDTGQAPADITAAEPAASGGAVAAQALRAPDGSETLASLEAELGPGQALDGATASRMSRALGVDVSSAHIHTGSVAARKATEVGALAFVAGDNVVMGASAPAAGTIEGDALLAHELTHTVQQSESASDPVARRKPIGGESGAAEDHADLAAEGAVAALHGAAPSRGGVLQRLGAALKSGIQLQRCDPKKVPAKTPSIQNYKDASNPAFDPGHLGEADIKATSEYASLRSSYGTAPYTEADAVLACRLAIRDLRQGRTVDLTTQGADYMARAHAQGGAAGGAEGQVGKLNWVPFNSGLAASDPSQLESEFAKWMLVASTTAPNATSGKMNCWELVMFGAYQAGVVNEARLRTIYQLAVKNVKDGKYFSVGQTFEEVTKASDPITFKLGDASSPTPLRGDIVVFKNAPNHACIATGAVTKNSITGADEHGVISLWTPSGGKVERTTIEALANATSDRPILFWSAKWN